MRRARVGDVIELKRRPVTIEATDEYVSIGIRSFGKGIFHYELKSGAELSKLRYFEVHPGELVVSNIKAWEGAVAVSSERERGCIASNRFLTYVPRNGGVEVGYLRYFFLSDAGLPLIQRASPGSADRNRTLAIERFEALEILLPDLDEQRRLVAAVEGRLTTAAALALRVGRLRDLAKALPIAAVHEVVDAEGSSRVRLGELIVQVRDEIGVDPMRSYPNVGVYSFARGLFEKPSIDGTTTSASRLYRIRAGQFIYSRLFAFEGAYTLVGPQFDKFFVSNEFPTFEIDRERLDPLFLAAYFSSPSVWRDLASTSKGLGLRRQRVHPDRILDHAISMPPLKEQQRIGRLYDLSRLIRAHVSLMDTRVTALTPSIINHAFSG